MPSLMHQNDHCMHRGRALIGHAREFGSARNMDEVNRHASTGDLFPLYNTGVLMFLLLLVVVQLWYT